MKPIQLEIRDVLGIREARLEFEPGVVAIVGANGAGKSSILDGLVIALFGEASPARAVRKSELVRLGSDAGEVTLVFESGGENYRVSRRFRSGKGQEAAFDRWNGTLWAPLASTVTEVNRAVGKLLNPWAKGHGEESLARLREAFLHSVFIPQGMVTRLIDARPADRWAVLASVLGLEQEEGLKERARALLEIAQGEERLAEGRLEALKERLEALPAEDGLDRREAEAANAIGKISRKKSALLQVLEIRKKLDEAEARLEKAGLDLNEGKLRFRKLQEQHRFGRAWEGLAGLQRVAHRFGDQQKNFREKAESFRNVDDETVRADERLEQLRNSYGKSLGFFRELEPLAKQAETVRRFMEARLSASRLEEKQEKAGALLAKRERDVEVLEKELVGAERTSLQTQLARVRTEHINAGHELAGLMEKIIGTLVLWLENLADEGRVVRLDRFTGARALELARNFRDSDLQRLVDHQGRVRQRCLALLEKGSEFRASLARMPSAAAGDSPVHRDPAKLRERLAVLGRETERLRGGLDSLEGELVRGTELRDEMAERLPDLSENFLSSVLDAAAKRESLHLQLENLQEKGEKARQSFDLLRERRALLQGDLGRLEERKANVLRDLVREREKWKALKREHGWSPEDLRKALDLALPPLDDQELAEARGSFEAARIAEERAARDLEVLRARVPDEPPPLEVLEGLLEGHEKELLALIEKRSAIRQVRTSRESLARDVENGRRKMELLLPAFDAARRMVRLSDGKGFIRFVSDNLLASLLSEVNVKLAGRGWTIRANQGVFEVIQDGGVRPAAGLSGGERAFLALLFLRQLSARTGFHKALFIDEGLAMLDDGHLEEVVEFLGTVGHDAFVAVITHDPEVAACFPRRWEVDKGRVVVREEV